MGGIKPSPRDGKERKRMDFLSSNLNTKEIPPWATQEDNRFLPAALRLACPWGVSHVIISKLLLSSPGVEAHPSTHADAQSLVFFPEEMERAAERAALCAHGHLVPGGVPSELQTFICRGLWHICLGPRSPATLSLNSLSKLLHIAN